MEEIDFSDDEAVAMFLSEDSEGLDSKDILTPGSTITQ